MVELGSFLLTLFLLPLFVGVLAENDPCPPAMLIKPCKCSSEVIPVIECENITDMEVIIEVFRRSGDRSFGIFALHHSSLMYLPVSSLVSKKIQFIMILNVTMLSLFNNEPDPSNVVETVVLQNATFQHGLKWDLFGNLKHLAMFHAKEVRIRTLAKSFSDNVSRDIRIIILEDTETKKLSDDVFANFENLGDIQITDGKLRVLKRSMFPRPAQIYKFIFTNNLIDSLQSDIFTDMPALEEVKLAGNRITVFSEEIFGDAYNRVSVLSLEGNPINCDCSVRWFISRKWKYVDANCATPEDRAERPLQSLTEEDFQYCH